MRLIDLAGRTFGRLTVLLRAGRNSSLGNPMWECVCICGQRIVVLGSDLRRGHTTSCGCYKADWSRAHSTIHGDSPRRKPAREWLAWRNARNRCFNPKNKAFADYGGRGITMCAEWRSDYPAFLAHVGRCPPGRTLDRIDNDGDYEPGNVRWATRSEQRTNSRPRPWERDKVGPPPPSKMTD